MQVKKNEIRTHIENTDAGPVRPRYELLSGEETQALDPTAGISLTFTYTGRAQCRHCQAPLRKKYAGAHCYTCFSTLPQCDLCIVNPSRCHLHLGTCRDPEWAESFCQRPHVLYLASADRPKIGITRAERVLRRWVEQGASFAQAIAHVPTRRAAGAIEARLARHVSDRTDWRRMVTRAPHNANFDELTRQLRAIEAEIGEVAADNLPLQERQAMTWIDTPARVHIEYPVLAFPPPTRLKVDADHPEMSDNLIGIKGGYLLLTQGVVPFSDLEAGDVQVSIGDKIATMEPMPQLDLF